MYGNLTLQKILGTAEEDNGQREELIHKVNVNRICKAASICNVLWSAKLFIYSCCRKSREGQQVLKILLQKPK